MDLLDSLLLLGISREKCAVVVEACLENRTSIRNLLHQLPTSDAPSYQDLEWRFDVQVKTLSHNNKYRNQPCKRRLQKLVPVSLFVTYWVLRVRLVELLRLLWIRNVLDNNHAIYFLKLSSRALRQQVTPSVLLKLHTRNGDQVTSQLLQTDVVNLVHLTQVLEQALDATKLSAYRKLQRNLWPLIDLEH